MNTSNDRGGAAATAKQRTVAELKASEAAKPAARASLQAKLADAAQSLPPRSLAALDQLLGSHGRAWGSPQAAKEEDDVHLKPMQRREEDDVHLKPMQRREEDDVHLKPMQRREEDDVHLKPMQRREEDDVHLKPMQRREEDDVHLKPMQRREP